jgi:alanyl-tRNA synthetase
MAREKGLKVDIASFDDLMEQQRQRARAAQKTSSFVSLVTNTKLPATDDSLKYKGDRCVSMVSGWITSDGTYISSGKLNASDGEVGLILKRTCFYAESGGQIGDFGRIESPSGEFVVENTEKIGDCIIHQGRMKFGTLTVNEQVDAVVDKDRDAIKKNHTATHLLQWALQQTLGKSVAQQGSLVCSEYLRFDFTWPKALTAEQIKEVENLVKNKIAADEPVVCRVMPRKQAQKLGAMALFGEKYGSEVRVVAIGAWNDDRLGEAFSKEFCGGTHVDKIGSIGGFKIIKEESISAGVRRITAMTGSGLAVYLEQRGRIVDELSEMLKVPAEEVADRVGRLIIENKKLAKELKSASKQSAADSMVEAKQLLDGCEKIGPTSLIIGRLSSASAEQAREAIDMLKKKAKSAAIVLGFIEDGNATLLAGVTDDLVKKGLKAADIVKQIAPLIEGGGGGRPQMAQAGGKNPEKIDEALTKATEIIKEKLTNT